MVDGLFLDVDRYGMGKRWRKAEEIYYIYCIYFFK